MDAVPRMDIDTIINWRARIASRTYGLQLRGKYAGRFAEYQYRNDADCSRLRRYLTCFHPYEALGIQKRADWAPKHPKAAPNGFLYHFDSERAFVAALVDKWRSNPS